MVTLFVIYPCLDIIAQILTRIAITQYNRDNQEAVNTLLFWEQQSEYLFF